MTRKGVASATFPAMDLRPWNSTGGKSFTHSPHPTTFGALLPPPLNAAYTTQIATFHVNARVTFAKS